MTPLETLLARHGDAPALEDLGGEDQLWAQADQLATSRLWFRAAETLLAAWNHLAAPDRAAAFIAEALTTETRPGVTGDLLDRLCDHPGYLQDHATTLNRIALRRTEIHASPLEAETAGLFLEAALRLALAGTTKRYGLLDLLVAPQAPAAPPGYARRVVRALGAAYEQWRDPDLTAALRPFLDLPELRSDAAFELAMCHLSDAFNAADRSSLLTRLDTSRTHFNEAISADEDRPDATAYRAAINAVLAFEAGDNETLAAQAAQLRRSTTEHALWLTGLRTGWRDGRYDTEAAWYTLSADLEQAAAHLNAPLTTWPSQTIQHILAAYTAHRSVRLTSTGSAPALQLLVAPRIEDAFAAREGLLLHVRGLLADAPPDWDRDAAEDLRSAVESRLGLRHEEPAVDGPGKGGPAAHPSLAAALGNQILTALPPAMLNGLREQVAHGELGYIAVLPKAEQDTFNSVVAGLEHCPDFLSASVRHHFIRLITATIRFLANRTNRGRDKHTKKTAYLFAPKQGEALPHEVELQEDLHDYLDSAGFEVQMEAIDRSGGRGDIIVRFPGFDIVIECKRELKKAQREDLKRYLGQTVAYQAAGVTLGMLAVLDLTPKPNWLANIRDSMWTEHIPAPDAAQRDRWAVVVRVPGNRTTPHDM
ncbi:hypothetical protein O1Q96_01495 (plasmid) [Streptomyces sp. Qhu-G9]|uniref:hypothetical protein n=1 Tax=Streptomyces sp. Qhu-G9 TaxID=3452799 RepID=UPI0022ABEC64|nr:hypothetical protein [Streptomyces aurantiacus]WAU78528.1 hypothetical protein O1Q96_01495 [Streptomyces aurantiacus]